MERALILLLNDVRQLLLAGAVARVLLLLPLERRDGRLGCVASRRASAHASLRSFFGLLQAHMLLAYHRFLVFLSRGRVLDEHHERVVQASLMLVLLDAVHSSQTMRPFSVRVQVGLCLETVAITGRSLPLVRSVLLLVVDVAWRQVKVLVGSQIALALESTRRAHGAAGE